MILELIDWQGGEMPVKYGTRVLVMHRDGELYITNAGCAYAEDWTHTDEGGDIVAYLVTKSIWD